MERGSFIVRYRRALGLAAFVAIVAACGEIAPLRYGTPGSFLHGALLAVAAIGFGWALRHVLCPTARVPMALQMVLGLGLLSIASGPFVAMRAFLPFVRFGLLGAGVIAAVAGIQIDPPKLRLRWRSSRGVVALALVACFVLVASQGTSRSPQKMDDDDGPIYLVLVKQLIQAGSMFQPLSFRRAQSLGGQSVLESLLVHRADLRVSDVLFFDQGFAALGVLALAFVEARSVEAAILSTLYLLLLPVSLHANTGATSAGALFFLGAIMLAKRERGRMFSGGRLGLLALLLAGACTLRQNYFVFAALIGGWILVTEWRIGRHGPTELARAAGVVAALVTAMLLPYLIASWRDVGTPLYPLLAGHVRTAASGISGGQLSLRDRFAVLYEIFLVAGWVAFALAPFILAALLARPSWKRPLDSPWLLLLVSAGVIVQWRALPLISAEGNVRYAYPILLVFVLAVISSVRTTALGSSTIAAIVGVVALGALGGPDLARNLQGSFTLARPPAPPEGVEAALEPGVPVAVMAEHAYLFDQRRNVVHTLDFPGVVSPDGRWPESAAAMHDALKAWGYRYLVVQTGGMHALYQRDAWRGHLKSDDPALKAMAPNMVHSLGMLDEIAQGRGAIQIGDYVVVGL